jgi:hypothetical protein
LEPTLDEITHRVQYLTGELWVIEFQDCFDCGVRELLNMAFQENVNNRRILVSVQKPASLLDWIGESLRSSPSRPTQRLQVSAVWRGDRRKQSAHSRFVAILQGAEIA